MISHINSMDVHVQGNHIREVIPIGIFDNNKKLISNWPDSQADLAISQLDTHTSKFFPGKKKITFTSNFANDGNGLP